MAEITNPALLAELNGGGRSAGNRPGGLVLRKPEDPFKASAEARANRAEDRADAAANKPPPGFAWDQNGTGLVAIPGGPADPKRKETPEAQRERIWAARAKGRDMLETIGQVREKVSDKSTGAVGQVLSYIGGTDANDINKLTDTLKANLAFDRLQEMRDNSETGAALGSISERELDLLGSTVANLDTTQSKPQLMAQVAKIERHYKRFLLSIEGIDPDSYKFDPFNKMKPEDARAEAQRMIGQGVSEEDVAQFLDIQDLKYQPEQLHNAVTLGHGRVVPGEPEVGMGVLKGLEHVGSRAARGTQAVLNGSLGTDFSFGSDWQKSMDDRWSNTYTDPSGEALGKFVGGIGGGLLAKGPVLGGALTSALMGDSDNPQSVAGDLIRGGVEGKLFDKAFRAVGGLLSPQIAPPVRNMNDRGIRMTPGQILGGEVQRAENLRTSLPFAGSKIERGMDQSFGDLQHAVQDEVLLPIKQSADRSIPPGRQGIADVNKRVGDEYNDVLSQSSYTWTPGMGQRTLSMLGGRRLRPDVAKEVADTVQYELGNTFANSPTITGREWKLLDERLGGLIENYRKQGGPMRDAADAIRDVKKDLFLDLVRQNGRNASRIRQADKAHRNARVLNRASLADKADGVPSPNQLLTASRSVDAAGKRAFAEGRAPLQSLAADAENVLPSGFANSRTTDRSIAADPTTKEGALAHAQGALLAPLYSEPFQRTFQRVMMAPRPEIIDGLGGLMRKTPGGVRGMFGASLGDRALFGSDGPYDQPMTEEEYRRLSF